MNNIAEIANSAKHIAYDKLVERYQNVEMSSLKSSIEVQSLIAEQLVSMLSEVSPHLGRNVNIVA